MRDRLACTGRGCGRRASCGLTLIELMVVIAIIGVVGLLAAPSFTEFFARIALRGTASEAFADMQMARAEAVQRNAPVTVTFSGTGYVIAWGANTIKTVSVSGGTTIASGESMVIVFDPVRATAAVTGGPVVFAHPKTSGTVRVSVNALGRAESCSPGGVVSGVASC